MGKNSFRVVVLGGLLACAALVAPAGAQAYVINVTTTADEFNTGAGCSLREALQVPNDATATDPLSFGGCTSANDPLFPLDEIRLPASSYTLTLDGVDDTNAAGDLDILNEGVSILGQATTGPTTIAGDIDGVGDDRIIDFHPSAANGSTQDLGLTGLLITGGRTTGPGAGIRINGPPAGGETITADLALLTVTGNSTTGVGLAVGGGIENQSGQDVDISESTISGNSAAGTGGGVDTSTSGGPADTQFENVTVSNNTADSDANDTGSGGGIAIRLAGATSTTYNTIFAGNFDISPASTVAPDCNGPLTSGAYNLIGNTTTCAITGGPDLVNIGAGLAPLALIPGAGLSTVLAHDLLPGSPAREAGNPAPVGGPVGSCGFLAQNFGPRPQGPRCDIGSVEADFIPPAGSGGGTGGAAAPLTAATGLRAAALKKCKKKKTATARRNCKRRANRLPV